MTQVGQVTVREARASDADELAAIHRAGYEEAHRGLVPDEVLDERTLEVRRRAWRERLRAPGSDDIVMVAVAGGEIIGFASLRPDRDEEPAAIVCWENLYIAPERIGTGVAESIAAKVRAEVYPLLERKGFTHVIAYVAEGNTRIIEFVKSYGWRLDGASRQSAGGRELRIMRPLGGAPTEAERPRGEAASPE